MLVFITHDFICVALIGKMALDDIDALDAITDAMSVADLFIADPINRKMQVTSLEETFNVYCTSVVARAVCYYKKGKGFTDGRFGGIVKPVVTQACNPFKLRDRIKLLGEATSMKRQNHSTLHTETLPYLAIISRAYKPSPNRFGVSQSDTLPQMGAPQAHDREMARILSQYSPKGFTKMDTAYAVDRLDKDLRAIETPRLVTNEEEDLNNPDPNGVLEDDDIC